jgi:lipopolysaccharide biosynthesis regulator YciM/predicted Ser/Thr protein kinase
MAAASVATRPHAASGHEPPLPSAIGRYRIIRLLGEGGMGAVYEAEQDQPRRSVALKVIKTAWASPELLRRFEQEAQALGRLHHPGIAQIYEAGSADAGFGIQPFFAMELIHGKPLVEYANEQKLTTRQRLELMIQVCDAVQHAHQRGIIHRDLKPGNILVDESGQPRVLDFGLARATDSDAQATRQTDIGQLLGTLAYVSPEQVLADPLALDTRTDVYALGVILYELLAGKMPYMLSKMLHEAVRTIQESDPVPLSTVSKTYRGDIETIVAKALEKDKNRRYGSAAALAGDIRRYLDDQPITAKPASASYQLSKFARRHKALVAGFAAVFVVLVLGVIASTWEAVQARRAEKKAQQQSAIAQSVNDFLQTDLLSQASVFTQAGQGAKPDPDLKVRTALDRAAQRIQGKFKDQPEVEAAIRTTIAETYLGLGLPKEGRSQYQSALELSRRALGPEDPKTLLIEEDLGWLATNDGDLAGADAALSKTLETDRRVLGERDPQTLETANCLGQTYVEEGKLAQGEALLKQTLDSELKQSLGHEPIAFSTVSSLASVYVREGKVAEAEQLTEKTLETARNALGQQNPDVLRLENLLVSIYFQEGKYPQAEALAKQIVEAQNHALGPEHPETLSSMQSLAFAYNRQGKYAEAEALYTSTCEAERRVIGPENPVTRGCANNLAGNYYAEGKFAQSADIDRQSLEMDRRTLGPQNPQTMADQNDLGWVEYLAGEYPQAETALKPVVDERRRVLGIENPGTWNSTGNLADVYTAEGKYGEAEKLYNDTLAAGTRLVGPERREVMEITSDLGIMNQVRGNYAQAESFGEQAYTRRRRAFGPQDPHTVASANDYALALVSMRKFAQSQPLAREYLAIDKQAYPDHWQRFRVASLLGASLAGEKKYAEAEPLLLEGLKGMLARKERIPVPYQYNLTLARQWVVQFYADRGKPEKAAEWKKK